MTEGRDKTIGISRESFAVSMLHRLIAVNELTGH